MRGKSLKACAAVIVIGGLLPSMALGDPLAPGKPAGIHNAQLGDKEWLVFGGVGLVAIAVAVANVGDGQHGAVTTLPITVVNTTSTAT